MEQVNIKSESKKNINNREFRLVYSDAEKKRDNYAIVRALVDVAISHRNDSATINEKFNNLGLAYGRWYDLESMDARIKIPIDGAPDLVYGKKDVTHHGGLENLIHDKASDLYNMPLDWSVKDFSKNAVRYRKAKDLKNIQDFMKTVYFEPLIREKTLQFNRLAGVKSDLDVTDEEFFKQRDAQVRSEVEASIDPDIKRASTNRRVPNERLWQYLVEFLQERSNLDYEWFKGSVSAVANGEVFYRRIFEHNSVRYEFLDEILSYFVPSVRSEFAEDGLLFNNDRYISPMEMVQENFHHWTSRNWRDIEKDMVDIPEIVYNRMNDGADITHTKRGPAPGGPGVVVELPTNGMIDANAGVVLNPVSYKNQTADGHFVEGLGKMMNDAYSKKKGFLSTFTTFLWSTYGTRVTRQMPDGRVVDLMRADHYKKSEKDGDLYVNRVPIPQTWQCKVEGNRYSEMGPVDYQYIMPDDWKNPKLAVFGGVFNTDSNRVKNSSTVSYAKTPMLKSNMLQDRLFDNIINDPGSIMFMDKEVANNSEGGLQGFLTSMYGFNTVFYDRINKGRNDYSDVRTINAGRSAANGAIADAINFYEGKVQDRMRTNASKRGDIGQYASRRNLELGINNYTSENFKLFFFWSSIRENMLNGLAQGGFYHFRNNIEFLEKYFDDEVLAHFSKNWKSIAGCFIKVIAKNNAEDLDIRDTIKQVLINNPTVAGDLDSLVDAVRSKTNSDINDVKEKAAKKERERFNVQAQQQSQAQQAELDSRERREAAEIQFRETDSVRKSRDRRFGNMMNAMMLSNANDIDKNSEADHLTKAREQAKSRERIAADKLELEKIKEANRHKERINKNQ